MRQPAAWAAPNGLGAEGPEKVRITAKNSTGRKGYVQFLLDGRDGEALGTVVLEPDESGAFVIYETDVLKKAEGVHDLFLLFSGEGYEIEAWQFEK